MPSSYMERRGVLGGAPLLPEGGDEYREILSLLREALERLGRAARLAEEAGLPFVMLPLRTMVMPVLHELSAQLDGYRNDFVASSDLELWPRIGEYAGGRFDFEVKRVRWEEV